MEFISGLAALSTTGSIRSPTANEKEKLRFAFKVYDKDEDGFISNGDLFAVCEVNAQVLKMMVGANLNDAQLQQLVDRTIVKADRDYDGLISFEEFCEVVKELDIASKLTLNYEQI